MERDASAVLAAVRANIGKAVVGKDEVIELLLAALIASGHVLIEDVPGLGKTTLAAALARSLDCTFSRIQFTPDVLPSDVTGFTTYDMATGERQVRFGAVMAQIVLADEINRTSPKTQSSLLEVMQEGQVTIDGVSYPAPQPFMVLATQNPAEMTGTYALPEAQLDRFLMRISVGYPSKSDEIEILSRNHGASPLAALEPVASADEVLALRAAHAQITCSPAVLDYIVTICSATRKSEYAALGASPRGSIALMNASAAWALLHGREYVIPDDVQAMALPVLRHRVMLTAQAGFRGVTCEQLISQVIGGIRVPKAR